MALAVHLEGGDALGRTGDFKVHVAVVVLEALDVGEDGPLVTGGDEPHRDATDHLLDRDTGVHEREGRSAGRGHRRRAVRLERLANYSNGARKLLVLRAHRKERALREHTVADLEST